MGIETAVLLATAAAAKGAADYSAAKSDEKEAREAQKANAIEEENKRKQMEAKAQADREDLSKQHQYEKGQQLSEMGASGLSMNTGSTLQSFVESQYTRGLEAARLDNNNKSEMEDMQERYRQANRQLQMQKNQAKNRKTGAIVGTVSGLANATAVGLK